MTKLIRFINYCFVRSRDRQQIPLDPRLKDYTHQQQIKDQRDELRKKFQKIPTQKFTTLLDQRRPKLGKRFHIQEKKLNKQIRNVYKKQIYMKNIETQDESDLAFLSAEKSHIYDHKQELEFEQKFNQQLFRTKQTKRLISKKQKQINNYISGKTKDEQYLHYEQAKKSLKNKKIMNMMNMNKNNQQLELLIQSGLFNNTGNFESLINELSSEKNPLLENKSAALSVDESKEIIESQQIHTEIEDKMVDLGPEQLKQREKVRQFIEKYKGQHQKDKESCMEDINLLRQIRQYQQKVFLSRYEDLNFRFKGRVSFSYFKQNQLISYIKNQNIEPTDLLLIFNQNQNSLSKFNLPILTPNVISAMYSKTSLYRFPETESNNRLNMLRDKKFISLQSKTFKQIAKMNDSNFCSVLWAYSQNHQNQNGLLSMKRYNKINQVLREELSFRIFNLSDEDLGLALRGASKLNLKEGTKKWSEIINYLQKRLPIVQNTYTVQSIFSFLMCLPFSHDIVRIVEKNIELYKYYEWEQNYTVLSFINAAGLLLKYRNNTEVNVKERIKDIIVERQSNLSRLLDKISINNMHQFLTVLRQSQASLALPKTVNLCKKIVVENIKMQKQPIKQYSVSNLMGNFALTDLQKFLSTKMRKFKSQNNASQSVASIKQLCIKSLVPFQPIPYNSSDYFIYHDMAVLAHTQMYNIPNRYLAQILQHLSLVRYKNQTLIDEISKKIIQNIETRGGQFQSPRAVVRQLISIINSYCLQRRGNEIVDDAISLLLDDKYFQILCKQSPNSLIRLITGILAISDNRLSDAQKLRDKKLQIILVNVINPYIRSGVFIDEQLASIAYSAIILKNYQTFTELGKVDFKKTSDTSPKFILHFANVLKDLAISDAKQMNKQMSVALDAELSLFYSQINEQILYNELCIGSPLSNKIVLQKIRQILIKTHKKQDIIEKYWFLEVPHIKTAYFVATYDHLISHKRQNLDRLEPFGVWKLFMIYYEILGWEVKTVISFMEGK